MASENLPTTAQQKGPWDRPSHSKGSLKLLGAVHYSGSWSQRWTEGNDVGVGGGRVVPQVSAVVPDCDLNETQQFEI